jgi:hypothetical protein
MYIKTTHFKIIFLSLMPVIVYPSEPTTQVSRLSIKPLDIAILEATSMGTAPNDTSSSSQDTLTGCLPSVQQSRFLRKINHFEHRVNQANSASEIQDIIAEIQMFHKILLLKYKCFTKILATSLFVII